MKNISISIKKKLSKMTSGNQKRPMPVDHGKKVKEAAQYVSDRVGRALARLSER